LWTPSSHGTAEEDKGQTSEVREQKALKMRLNSAKDLEVYKKAYALAMRIFKLSKRFPSEERYALSGMINDPSSFLTSDL
jgi:23S rRNA-intervening sequence protein